MVTDQISFSTSGITTTIFSSLNGAGVADGIDENVVIDGCSSVAMPTQPCAQVRGDTASFDLFGVLRADDSTIKGLSMTDANRAMFVDTTSSNLTLRNNWFGVAIDGSLEANNQGVVLNGDGATVGGTAAADRNVFAVSGTALQITGDNNQVLGNWFGVEEDGTTAAANSRNIIVGDAVAAPTGNVIGAADIGSDPGTCDDGCNVIANATGSFPNGQGIDLHQSGSMPAEDTTITGNFIGLNTAGLVSPNLASGIRVVNAPGTTIGGSTAADRNYIAGGGNGISAAAQGAPDLDVQNNFIGVNPAGTGVAWGVVAGSTGVFINSDPGVDAAEFRDNRLALPANGDNGLALSGPDAQITGNTFGVGVGGGQLTMGFSAMRLTGFSGLPASGLNISNNVIGNTAGSATSLEGVRDSVIAGNYLGTTPTGGSHPIGGNGLQFSEGGAPELAEGNTIGGDTAPEENVISNAGGDAIMLANDMNDGNLIDRNRGSNNGGMFIDLVDQFGVLGDGPGNPVTGSNDGIQAPMITSATTTTIQGTGARAGATIRVYSKTTAADGDVEAFLGSTVAAMDGTWQLTYGATPPSAGKLVTANQTDTNSNSSEMAAAATTQGPSTAPTVTTSAASLVTSSAATLNGAATPNGASTTGWFRYSTTNPGTCNDSFGTRAPSSGGSALGSGTSSTPFSESISGLSPGTTYYFCAIASNSEGTSFGAVLSFTTSQPPVQPTPPAATPAPTTTAPAPVVKKKKKKCKKRKKRSASVAKKCKKRK